MNQRTRDSRPVVADPPDATSDDGKIRRISAQTRNLVDDVKSWVELKMTLTQMEIEEKVDARVNEAVNGAMLAALFLMAALFGLTAVALGLGAWLGHPGWGFLIVMALLIVVAVILRAAKPKMVDVRTPDLPGTGGGSNDR